MRELKKHDFYGQWQTPTPCYRAELPLHLPPEASFVYRSANNMVLLAAGSNVFSPPAFDGEYLSEDVIVVGDEKSGEFILVGALTAQRSLSYFTLMKHGRFHAVEVKQPGIAADGKPEEILVLAGKDWRKLLIEYAERSAAAMGCRQWRDPVNVVGYCSWYYYYAGVTEADLLENLAALSTPRNRRAFPVGYLQIDDGYQTFQGDWLDRRDEWPTPLVETCAKIRESGFAGGIWLMPFLASTASRVFREHPQWFVREPNGNPLIFNGWSPPPNNHWACLDATQAEVRAHLQQIFRTFRNWGFTFFKMDGMGFALPDGVRADSTATAVSAFRQGLAAIREAVPDATLLGCGAPFMPCLGLIDHCRVSNDTGREWLPKRNVINCDANNALPCIANALHATLANWWMSDRWFRADPDALMARQDHVASTEGEARISVLTGILTGIAVTSDNLNTIAPQRLDLLQKAAHYRLYHAKPHRWETDSWPQIFTGIYDSKHAVAIFNDSEQTMQYRLNELGFPGKAFEVLQDLGEIGEVLTLPCHDAAFLIET